MDGCNGNVRGIADSLFGEYPGIHDRLCEFFRVIGSTLLRGEEVTLLGETITIDAARMVGPVQPVPISIGTRSPQVMRLAGELADTALVGGRIIDTAIANDYHRWLTEGAARTGRDVTKIDVAPRLTLCISRDGALARRSMKRYVA